MLLYFFVYTNVLELPVENNTSPNNMVCGLFSKKFEIVPHQKD